MPSNVVNITNQFTEALDIYSFTVTAGQVVDFDIDTSTNGPGGLGSFLRPDFELADDFDFYHRLLAVGGIARLNEVLTTYRYHAANASLARAE